MKRYQIAILSFALGIFAVTSLGLYFIKRVGDDNAIVQISPMPQEYRTIKVYFSNNLKDPNSTDCEKTYPVERAVNRLSENKKSALAEYAYQAISELLSGPAQTEKDSGYFTSINEGTKLQRIIIEQGIATVDFNEKLDENIAGSCKVLAIRSQITETLKQFPEINEVKISINDSSEDILQP